MEDSTRFITHGIGENTIKKVTIEKETDASVWIGGERHSKRNTMARFHNTWREAKIYITDEAVKDVNGHRAILNDSVENLKEAMALKEPIEHVQV